MRNRGINGDARVQRSVSALYYSEGSSCLFDTVLCLQRYIAVLCVSTAMTQASVNSMRGDESPFYTFAYSVGAVLSVYSWTLEVSNRIHLRRLYRRFNCMTPRF